MLSEKMVTRALPLTARDFGQKLANAGLIVNLEWCTNIRIEAEASGLTYLTVTYIADERLAGILEGLEAKE